MLCKGRWVTRRELNKDPDFRNRSRVDDLEFDRLVRNVHKVLLTGGMVGTVLASVDAETQQMRSHLVPVRALTSASEQRAVAPHRRDRQMQIWLRRSRTQVSTEATLTCRGHGEQLRRDAGA